MRCTPQKKNASNVRQTCTMLSNPSSRSVVAISNFSPACIYSLCAVKTCNHAGATEHLLRENPRSLLADAATADAAKLDRALARILHADSQSTKLAFCKCLFPSSTACFPKCTASSTCIQQLPQLTVAGLFRPSFVKTGAVQIQASSSARSIRISERSLSRGPYLLSDVCSAALDPLHGLQPNMALCLSDSRSAVLASETALESCT